MNVARKYCYAVFGIATTLFVFLPVSAAIEDPADTATGTSIDYSEMGGSRIHERRTEDVGFGGETDAISDFLLFAVFIMFILAMAFPAAAVVYFKSCPQVCCCCWEGDRRQDDGLPIEIGDGLSGDFQLCTQVSSTSMGSGALV